MVNEEIADIFEKMSRVLAFKGANRFRALAYERAARSLRDLDEDLTDLARQGKLEEIPGIGEDLAGKIEEYIKTRRIRLYDQERRDVPEGLIALMDIPGLGPKTLSLLREYGVFRGEKRLGGVDEDEVYRLVGVPITPPELREDRGEIEAAIEGRLPKLVELDDLRGDLHMRTNYSDGRATIEEMVEGAASLGYEYIALTDHSPSARIARGLDRDRLEKKIEEVESVRERRGPRKPRILLGAEVDILADGRLDYPEEILARFDVVVAAVHSSFRQSRDRMTMRLLEAISNPYVHILAHPLTRLMGSREPAEFDFERIVEAAIEAGMALELNSQPLRLDLTDTMARAAQEAGALLAIDTDAHSVGQLELIRYGVSQARRGWVEARSVVNTWTWAKLSRWLATRRRRELKAA
jgi:DNA polymerase (family 10)